MMDDRTQIDEYIRAERLRILARYPFVSMLPDGKLITDPCHPACRAMTHAEWRDFYSDSFQAHNCTVAEAAQAAAELAALTAALPKRDYIFVPILIFPAEVE